MHPMICNEYSLMMNEGKNNLAKKGETKIMLMLKYVLYVDFMIFLTYELIILWTYFIYGITLAPWVYNKIKLLWAIVGILHNAYAMIVESSK